MISQDREEPFEEASVVILAVSKSEFVFIAVPVPLCSATVVRPSSPIQYYCSYWQPGYPTFSQLQKLFGFTASWAHDSIVTMLWVPFQSEISAFATYLKIPCGSSILAGAVSLGLK